MALSRRLFGEMVKREAILTLKIIKQNFQTGGLLVGGSIKFIAS